MHTNGQNFNSNFVRFSNELFTLHDLDESLFRTQLIAFHSPQAQLIGHCFAAVTSLVSQIDNWWFSLFQNAPLLPALLWTWAGAGKASSLFVASRRIEYRLFKFSGLYPATRNIYKYFHKNPSRTRMQKFFPRILQTRLVQLNKDFNITFYIRTGLNSGLRVFRFLEI